MGKSLAVKVLSVLAVAVVLTHASPVVAETLMCIGDGSNPDCCDEAGAPGAHADATKRIRDASDCDCCITVEVAPSSAGAAGHKASPDFVSGSGLPRDAVSPACPRTARPGGNQTPGSSSLASLRTVVLLN